MNSDDPTDREGQGDASDDHRSEPFVAGEDSNRALKLVNKILSVGVNGLGPYKSAPEIAEEALSAHGDREIAIRRLIATHRRWVGSSGFATGLGGLPTLPVTVATDITAFYMLCARMSAAIAILRGYDIDSEEVKSAVLISLLGANAAAVLGNLGVEIGTKTAMAQLKRLPGRILIEINKKVGYRLLTKTGNKGLNKLSQRSSVGRWRRRRRGQRCGHQSNREVRDKDLFATRSEWRHGIRQV